MKRVIFKIVIFGLIVVAVDFAMGLICNYLRDHTAGGDTLRHTYINKRTSEDVLVVGSSRAKYHYNPVILEDSTGFTAYNTGVDGNGVILFYMQLLNITERYRPKYIIYDFQAPFDLAINDNSKYLSWEKPFYGENPRVDSVFVDIDWRNKYKFISKSFMHNSRLLQYVSDALHPLQNGIKGYFPLSGTVTPGQFERTPQTPLQLDSVKYKYLNKYCQLCKEKGIGLVFVISPSYFGNNGEADNRQIQEIARKWDVPFIDFTNHKSFTGQGNLFVDTAHMNGDGADLFTRVLLDSLSFEKRMAGHTPMYEIRKKTGR